ncbi:protein inscuteable homolog isoform X2 [Liolophura sinensis]|uniref:protein inscuteable homolog isoform X2 n=1 Tax=Liolophura sinensis TaxID=3198878 RepID=UPI0031582D75
MMNEDVNPVGKWLEELRMMTEGECMCILQGKSLVSDKSPPHPVQKIKDGIDRIREQANIITGDFSKLFRVEKEKWKHLSYNSLQVTCPIRGLISLSNTYIPDPPTYIMEQEEVVMGECAKLAQQADSFNINTCNSAVLRVRLVNQLTFLGQSFSRLVDLLLSHLVQSIVMFLEEAETPQELNTALSTLISLGLEGEHMCYIIAREGGLRVLFDICRSTSLQGSQSQALRAVATICCVTESILELERVGGVECVREILCDSRSSEELLGEAAGVIAQITSPCLENYQHISGFQENMADLVPALIVLCDASTKPEVMLLSTAALANMTFMDSTACELLHQAGAPRVLAKVISETKASSLFAKDQVATILANMAAVEVCRNDIVEHRGIELLLSFLHEGPTPRSSEAELSACERVQQKAAIALTRLSRDAQNARAVVQQHGMPRLVQLCRDVHERNDSDAVLVACLAALRKICSLCGVGDMSLIDVQQLVQPRLMDSFLICTHRDENFV